MIRNIIFDFDGVLVDSEILVSIAFSRYLKELGYDFDQKDFFKFSGKKTYQVVSYLSDKLSIDNKEKFYKNIMSISSNIYSNELTTVVGALEYIKKSKKNLFIGSNSIKSRILIGLKKVKLDSFFNERKIFSFDMVKRAKPFPDIYLKVVDNYSLKKKETVIVEDSVVGVKAAVAAGIKVIGLTAGGHWKEDRSEKELIQSGAFKVVNDFKLLDNILDKL